ncbi:MAG: hypothetical protein NTX64_18895 [Elusimicrobia bacterium]|nr:hypothetical protein [Elusimicrobiota bacterium]
MKAAARFLLPLLVMPLLATAGFARQIVIVYVWGSAVVRESRVGHVSVLLRDDSGMTYVSFWPKDATGVIGKLAGAEGAWHQSLSEDIKYEDGRVPESAVDMSELDEPAMKSFFASERSKSLKWGVLRGDTCESVASNALRAGGLVVNSCDATSPHRCGKRLRQAYANFQLRNEVSRHVGKTLPTKLEATGKRSQRTAEQQREAKERERPKSEDRRKRKQCGWKSRNPAAPDIFATATTIRVPAVRARRPCRWPSRLLIRQSFEGPASAARNWRLWLRRGQSRAGTSRR